MAEKNLLGKDDAKGTADDQKGSEESSASEEEHDLEWWRTTARKHERNARSWKAKAEENEAAAVKLKELQEADLSEAEKEKRRADELQAQLDERNAADERAGWVRDVSKSTGVPEAALHGSTLEEVESCAESLKDYFKDPAAPAVNTGKPSDDGGSTGDPLRDMINGIN